MIRKKFKVVVPEGEIKELLISKISSSQKTKSILTHRDLWRLVAKNFPELKNKEAHFTYIGLTEELILMEGLSDWSFFKYTF